MAFQATFGYNNLEAVSDLNLATKVLVKKGVVTGFDVSPVPGTVNVTVGTGYLVSDDGMIVRSTDVETLACEAGQKNNVVFRAVYNAPQDPTLQLEVLTDASLASDPQRNYLVRLAVVDLTSATQTTASNISYTSTDRVSIQGRDTFLGPYDNSTQLFSAYPSTAPVKQCDGDFALVKSDAQAKPAFYVWIAGTWITLGNYEDLLLQYEQHVSGVVGYGTSVHVTLAEKAAIGGTMGAPGPSNRFVTETDYTRLTTLAQKAAIDNAISGPLPLSATNPLVANGIPVSIPEVVGVTLAAAASDTITITYGDTGANPFFGVAVYVGKLGLDAAHNNKSTARFWFDLQDSSMAGYVDEDGPLYILDIMDSSGSGSFNPAADDSVSNPGYWKPSTAGASLVLKLNRPLARGKTVYVRFYASGTISGLAPQNAYRPPATARSNALESYREINTASIMNLLTGTTEASGSFIASIGSAAVPGFQFRMPSGNLNGSGLFYLGDIVESNYAFYNSIGVAAANDTIVVFAKAVGGDNGHISANQAPLVFEQIADGTTMRYRMHLHSAAPAGLASIEIGTSVPAGYTNVLRMGQLSSVFYGAQFDTDVIMSTGKAFHADIGTSLAPAVSFGDDHTSGLFAVPSFSAGSLSYYNAVGIATRGRSAFVFASSTATADGLVQDAHAPLLFQQYLNSGKVGYSISVARSASGAAAPDAIRFGASPYSAAFVEWGRFSPTGLDVTGAANVSGNANVGGSISLGAGTSGLSSDANQFIIGYGARNLFAYSRSYDKIALGAAAVEISGKLTLASGTEAAPTLSFVADTGTGLFYAGNVDTTDGVSTRKAVGVSIEGSTVVLIGRNEVNPGTLGQIQSPLLIEQSVGADGASELRLAAMDRSADGSSLVLGVANYVSDFTPYLSMSGSQIHASVRIYANLGLTAMNVTTTDYVQAATSVRVTQASTTASAPAFRLGTNSGLYGNPSGGVIGLSIGGTSVLETSTSGGTHLVLPLATSVTGKITANGGADINGALTTDAVSVGGLASFASAASFSSTLGVTGLASLTTLDVSGRTTMHNDLTLAGTAYLIANSDVHINGALQCGDITIANAAVLRSYGSTHFYVDALGTNVFIVDPTASFNGGLSTTNLNVSGVATITNSGSLVCNGSAVFNGSVTFGSGGASNLTLNSLTASIVTATSELHVMSGLLDIYSQQGAAEVSLHFPNPGSEFLVRDYQNTGCFHIDGEGGIAARNERILGSEHAAFNAATAVYGFSTYDVVGNNKLIIVDSHVVAYMPMASGLNAYKTYYVYLGSNSSVTGQPTSMPIGFNIIGYQSETTDAGSVVSILPVRLKSIWNTDSGGNDPLPVLIVLYSDGAHWVRIR